MRQLHHVVAIYGNNILPRLIMIIITIIILCIIQIRHTDDFPSTGTRLVLYYTILYYIVYWTLRLLTYLGLRRNGSFMTAGVGLNGQINVFKSLSPVLSQVVSWYGCFVVVYIYTCRGRGGMTAYRGMFAHPSTDREA